MYRSGGHEDDVTGRDWQFGEQVLQSYRCDGALNLCPRGGRLEAVNNRCAGGGIQHVPELCFAQFAALVLSGVAIVGVNLYRKFGVGVDEFGQQWKTMAEDSHSL